MELWLSDDVFVTEEPTTDEPFTEDELDTTEDFLAVEELESSVEVVLSPQLTSKDVMARDSIKWSFI
jgi:hypothetical protein